MSLIFPDGSKTIGLDVDPIVLDEDGNPVQPDEPTPEPKPTPEPSDSEAFGDLIARALERGGGQIVVPAPMPEPAPAVNPLLGVLVLLAVAGAVWFMARKGS